MKKCFATLIVLLFFLLSPFCGHAGDNAISIGYGFGALNNELIGKIDQGNYDFFQLTYMHERPWHKNFYLLIEPYVSYINRPTEGLDMAFGLSTRYYFKEVKQNSFFATLGIGALYSTLQYSEQAHHYFFLVQGGIGYRWNSFFIEDKFRHYSNGYTSDRNKAIHSNILSIGIFF